MPMYDFACSACGSVTSRFRKIAARHDDLACSDCGEAMRLAILNAPFGRVQPEAHYICPATGERITSWRQRQNNFARNGLESADPDQQSELYKKRQDKKAKRDALARNYLPTDLRKKISKIGQNSDNGFYS